MEGHLQLLQLSLFLSFLCTVQSFVNSPKIISKDGNLIFESGANRNISFRLNGNSRLLINGEYDVLDLLLPISAQKKGPSGGTKDEWSGPEDIVDIHDLAEQLIALRRQTLGPTGLNSMLRQLQNKTRAGNVLLRRLQGRLRDVENKAQRLKTKLELNSCQSSPCENGGTCYNTYSGFRCQCRAAFEGTKCERDVNECAFFEGTDLGCQNGGQCVNQFGSFSCICTPGWHGLHCSQRKTDCGAASAWELCGHGSCVPSSDALGYRCICDAGWKSSGATPTCTEDVDECSAAAHTPCSTKCINLPGSFTCAPCAAGLTGNGVSCRDINECETNNGGCSLSPRVECINSYGSSHCGECPVGWTGDGRSCVRSSSSSSTNSPAGHPTAIGLTSCSQRAGLCHPTAICSEISNTIVCSCPQGMVGNGYGENPCIRGTNNNCNSLPCLNGGVCLDNGPSNYTCMCPRGFRPPNCEPAPDPCTPQTCHNNGRCIATPSSGGFVCQCRPGYRGRLCETQFSSCNAVYVGESGQLRYPPQGNSYQHNAQCAWVLRTNESLVLNVTFHSFNLEDSTECRFDWLQINDGRSAAAQIIGRYCGNRLPHGGNIISSSHQLYLWFRSDNSTAHEGFNLTWQSMEPQCGGLVEFETHGTLASPGSPGNYPRNRDCQWHLVAPSNKRIKLTFFGLQLEQHTTCNFDFVQISDAISGMELYKYCSSQQPPPLLLFTHEAIIRFHSDETGTDLGFQLHFSVEERLPGCGGVFTQQEGSIVSPAYMAGTGPIACDYDIRMSSGESIAIDFVTFKMAPDSCLELYDVPSNMQNHSSGILSSKHCGISGIIPPTFQSLYSRVRIKFYSSGSGKDADDEFKLDYRMDCSRIFESANGTITSPNYPNAGRSESCSYKIHTAPNTIIVLRRIDFQLENTTEDSSEEDYDYESTSTRADSCVVGSSLTINDGINLNILGPYCHDMQPPEEYVSKSNMLVIHLNVQKNPGRGFKFEYRAMPLTGAQCGGVYTRMGPNIRPPMNADGYYHNNVNCNWIIMAPPGKAILIHWLSMDLENSDCSYDSVTIFDELNVGPDASDHPLIRVCGNTVPQDLLSHSRHLTIKFHSDFADSGNGFELSYQFVEPDNCGGHLHASTGILNSPQYPLNYTNGLDCIWHLTAGEKTQIELEVELFELDKTPRCSGDWLEIRNGNNNNSVLIGRFCGSNIPRRIPSFTHELYLHFHTDDVVAARGFHLKWRTFANGCGGRLIANSGAITSPNYPSAYPNSMQCVWELNVHAGSKLTINIEDFSMESSTNCYYDYLRVEALDALLRWENPITICKMPEENKNVIRLDSNRGKITFRSDISNADRGFRLSYSSDCQVELNAIYGVIESLNFENPYFEDSINCSWQIRAPRGNRIFVEVSHLDRRHEEHPEDAVGGLYVINGSAVIPLVGLEAHNFSNNFVTIVHNTSAVNFRMEYHIEGCLYELREKNGTFRSPNYPQMYPNDVECLWQIHAPIGSVIELTVLDMDIQDSVNCTKDVLVISNSINEPFPTEHHCGARDNMIITSAGSKLYIRFKSDNTTNGIGFEATYRILKSVCGGKLTKKSGTIQSPNYPRDYPRNSDCEWMVEVSPHHTIIFDIEDLELETSSNCTWDKLSVVDLSAYNGPTSGENDQDDTEGAKLFEICTGSDTTNHYESGTNRALVRFNTDGSVQHKGFRLHFYESCGQSLLIDETDFQYISISHQLVKNETCVWVIRAADPSKHIIFTPTHVHLHTQPSAMYINEGECMPHGVKIYEGITATGTPRLQFCRSHPPALISHGDALTISVPLLLVAEFEANYMTMDSVCGSDYNSLSGRFTSPYYPASYPVNIECEWIIQASDGNSISLTFESFEMELSDGCNNDYLELREESSRGKLIGVYCGNQLPSPVKSVGTIWLKFKSNDDVVGEGFMISYNYDHHNELNGTEGTILSPHYPTKLETNDAFSWRITVDPDYVVLLYVDHLRDVDVQHIHFYDGYTSIGPQLVPEMSHPLVSNTNVMYITATRGPFKLSWERLSKTALESNNTSDRQQCGDQLVTIDRMVIFNSPGYPSGYATNLHCVWDLMSSETAMHTSIQLLTVDLEIFSEECMTDYLIISSSTDLQYWSQLDKICRPLNESKTFHGQPYLRLEFVTDASVNKTGFSSRLRSVCGSELTATQGVVNITNLLGNSYMTLPECVWTIRVRLGRRIRITFLESQLRQSTSSVCQSFFLVRNGYAEDSPFLGRGKFCENNITDVLETSSNRAYIKFQRYSMPFYRAAFKYEELGHACSGNIVLQEGPGNFSSRVINSPNYPNLPNPYSECVWRIIAPSQHRIAVEFINKFDLTPSSSSSGSNNSSDNSEDGCDQEFVQLNDGSTELMPQLGRFCGNRKPDVIYSSGSTLRIKFFTGLLEPKPGFQAIVKLADCGGSYFSSSGLIESPKAKDLQIHQHTHEIRECVYTIEVEKGSTIEMSFESIELPMVQNNCTKGTHILLEEMEAFEDNGESEKISDHLVFCERGTRTFIVETNKVVMRLRIPSGQLNEEEGFKLRYRAVGSRCFETIHAVQGILQTPNYPVGVRTPTHCVWRIVVPKGRRVRVEILDFNIGVGQSFHGRLTFANDFKMKSIIGRYMHDPPPAVISSDNTMGIDAFLLPFVQHRGFKLRFSVYGTSECLNYLSSGELKTFRRDNNASSIVYCTFPLRPPQNTTMLLQVHNYTSNSFLMNNTHICSMLTPLTLVRPDESESLLPKLLCRGSTTRSVRVPFPIDMTISGNRRNEMNILTLSYSIQRCGGNWPLEPGDNMIITQPDQLEANKSIDCAWAVGPDGTAEEPLAPQDVQLEVSVSAHLIGNCQDHYLLVYNGPDQNSPLMGRYCNDVTEVNKVVERGLFVEYHAESTADPNHNSTFNVTVRYGSGCGGRLVYPYRQIDFSEQYKNNVECVWEIEAGLGFHVGLAFVERFYIENSAGCTKDYLRVQQLNETSEDNHWVDIQTLCGRDPPKYINSTSSKMRLIFRSDGDITGDGFTVRFERNCGGVFYADDEAQTMSSPGYPSGYSRNLHCTYKFVPRVDTSPGVLINFRKFDLERSMSASCLFDNVTITTTDSADQEQKSVLCGLKERHAYRAKQSISLVLQSDNSFQGTGFLLEYSTRLCGSVVNGTQVVESPRQHQDNQMPHNSDCYWNLTAPEGHKFTVKFELLQMESSHDCSFDGVEVFASPVPDEKQRLARFCGHITSDLPILHISTNRALIHSYSDDSQASSGFKAIVRVLANCDEQIILGEQNSTYTFNKFGGQYANDLDCSFVFKAPSGYHVEIEFRNFHVEASTNCSADYLNIRDGGGPFADSIGTFCGQDLPQKIASSHHSIYMRFVTNDNITDTGFEMIVTAKPLTCGNTLINYDGNQPFEMHSPLNEQGHYDNDIMCLWRIKSELQLHLQFLSLDLQEPDAEGTCQDYVKIYEGESSILLEEGYGNHVTFNGKTILSNSYYDYATEHIYCGTGKPNDYYPNTKEIYVKFRSNGAVTKTGFRLRVVPDSGCRHNYGGIQGRVKFSGTVDCDVYITAPPNYYLSLYYAELTFASNECSDESLEVFEKATNKSLQRVCSELDPGKSLFTRTNEIRLHFKTGNIYTTLDMTYVATKMEVGPGCGGELYNTEGIITNAFYPETVRNNSVCTWNIRVPSNNLVLLQFINFNMGSKATCRTDYLKILEDNNAGQTEEMRRYCGEDTPTFYRGKHSQLVLQFHKSVNYGGIGWVIKFLAVSKDFKIPFYMATA